MGSKISKKRLAAVVTLNAAVGATLALSSAPAHAAGPYFTFKNKKTSTCLSGGVVQSNGTGSAWAATCNPTSYYQQWEWIGPYGTQLKNRASGLCLMTDTNTSINAVWTSGCAAMTGQNWLYHSDTGYVQTGFYGSWLRTDPKAGAIYTDAGQIKTDAYVWSSTAVS
jgi:hypothetical protein